MRSEEIVGDNRWGKDLPPVEAISPPNRLFPQTGVFSLKSSLSLEKRYPEEGLEEGFNFSLLICLKGKGLLY